MLPMKSMHILWLNIVPLRIHILSRLKHTIQLIVVPCKFNRQMEPLMFDGIEARGLCEPLQYLDFFVFQPFAGTVVGRTWDCCPVGR